MQNCTNDLTGTKFNHLTVIGKSEHKGAKWKKYWDCLCVCGTVKPITTYAITHQRNKSCGCRKGEGNIGIKSLSGLNKSEFNSWWSMKNRCYDPNHKNYKHYGGRGIRVCEEWNENFSAFLNDMGKKPTSNHTIERVEIDKGYYKENCKWATKMEQARNKRNNVIVTFEGKTMCLAEWAEFLGVHRGILAARIRKGWAMDKVLSTPQLFKKGVCSARVHKSKNNPYPYCKLVA
jgi:hypothetical protein